MSTLILILINFLRFECMNLHNFHTTTRSMCRHFRMLHLVPLQLLRLWEPSSSIIVPEYEQQNYEDKFV